MKPLNENDEYERWLKAANKLWKHGWRSVGGWLFEKNGRRYDLSAADIDQHERIECEGVFIVAYD